MSGTSLCLSLRHLAGRERQYAVRSSPLAAGLGRLKCRNTGFIGFFPQAASVDAEHNQFTAVAAFHAMLLSAYSTASMRVRWL